jgi:murein DD-endopeptidase MepM/ murein hydrolase activator NlpD
VRITDGRGVEYFYGHLDRFARGLRPGQRVQAGRTLGYIGNTGDATGGPTHVHFEIHLHGLPTPPKPYVDRWLLTAEVRASRLHRGSEGPESVSAPAHRDVYVAAFGGPVVVLDVATTSLRPESDESPRALWTIGGGILLAFVLLGFLRAGPRRRETNEFVANTSRSSELLRAMVAHPDPEPAVVTMGSTVPPAVDDAAFTLGAPNPSRSGVAIGLMVIVAVVATTWSWVK